MDESQNNWDTGGFLRLKQVHGLIPVSKAYWYEGVQRGIFPAAIKMVKVAFYRRQDIAELHEKNENGDIEEAAPDEQISAPSMQWLSTFLKIGVVILDRILSRTGIPVPLCVQLQSATILTVSPSLSPPKHFARASAKISRGETKSNKVREECSFKSSG